MSILCETEEGALTAEFALVEEDFKSDGASWNCNRKSPVESG